MPEQYQSDLNALNDYEEIFHFTENIVKNNIDFDGLTIVIYHKEEKKFMILTDDLQWRDIPSLPESLIRSTFESHGAQLVSNLEEDSILNWNLDCFGDENTSALLLYPIIEKDQDIDVVFSFRKRFKKEKDEVMEPLIVGSQMMGVTTRVKSTVIPQTFKEEDTEVLQTLEEGLLVAVKKLLDQIEAQKKAILNQIAKDEQVFNTPQEIISTLVNILMGTNTSIHNLQDTLDQIKDKIHRNDKIMPQVTLMQEILDTLDQNIMNTFRFSTTNNIIQELFKGKETVETKNFFEYFCTFGQNLVCQKNLTLNFFLDPKLPSQISIERQSTYIMIIELLRFSLSDVKNNMDLNLNISKGRNGNSILCKITYDATIEDPKIYHNMLISNQSDHVLGKSVHLSYTKFVQTGGKVSIGTDVDKQKVSFSIEIPFEQKGSSSILLDPYDNKDIKIGLLLKKEEDYQRANNIVRHLFALGVSKEQIRASENIKLFSKDLTHLIVFESQFSQDLFENTLKEKKLNTMIITNGCLKEEDVTFYDYSMVDLEVDKNSFYMYDLKDFIQLEYE